METVGQAVCRRVQSRDVSFQLQRECTQCAANGETVPQCQRTSHLQSLRRPSISVNFVGQGWMDETEDTICGYSVALQMAQSVVAAKLEIESFACDAAPTLTFMSFWAVSNNVDSIGCSRAQSGTAAMALSRLHRCMATVASAAAGERTRKAARSFLEVVQPAATAKRESPTPIIFTNGPWSTARELGDALPCTQTLCQEGYTTG